MDGFLSYFTFEGPLEDFLFWRTKTLKKQAFWHLKSFQCLHIWIEFNNFYCPLCWIRKSNVAGTIFFTARGENAHALQLHMGISTYCRVLISNEIAIINLIEMILGSRHLEKSFAIWVQSHRLKNTAHSGCFLYTSSTDAFESTHLARPFCRSFYPWPRWQNLSDACVAPIESNFMNSFLSV